MYLVVIAVLSILLSVPEPLYRWATRPGDVLAAVAAATLMPALIAGVVAWRAVRLLDRHVDDPGRGQVLFGRGMLAAQIALGAGWCGIYAATDWLPLLRRCGAVFNYPMVDSVCALVPFVISILLLWTVSYPADRAVRQIALELDVFRGKPVRPLWHLGGFLLYNLRHQVLFVLAPMLLILLARDLIEQNRTALVRTLHHPHAPDVLLGVAAMLVALVAPAILRIVWVTQRLPEGPLRDRLEVLAQRLRVRCADILVWRAGGMLVNAAVMGVVPPLRYVLITDAMLEQMDDRKIEAVFGHEAGHVKRHHILFFMLFALITGCLVTIVSVRSNTVGGAYRNAMFAGLGALLLVKWGIVFGWISRRFERQADLFGAYALAVAGLPCVQPCALHGAADARGPRRRLPLCATAAHIFGDTLNQVAILNGIPPEAPSWRHSSISSRSRFLQRLAADPAAARDFERRVFWVKTAIFVVALCFSLWAAEEMRLWTWARHFW